MSRRAALFDRKCGWWIVVMLGLAICLVGCGPDAPSLVTALPSLTVTPFRPAATASPSLAPSASPTVAPTQTHRVLETLRVSTATPTATAQPAASATSEQAATPPTADLAPPTPDGQALARKVRLPILMYHYVEPWPANASTLRQRLTVQPADFAEQMAYLHSQGYATVSLYDLMAALALGQPLPDRAVVLSFDDGYRTLMDYALPALKPYGYTGTIFVITQFMDENFPQYLTWSQAEALYAAGWKIEPHTKTHPDLSGRSHDYQLYEMLGSAQTVEAHIGAPPRFFAFPYGHWDAVTLELAREMHLWAAVTELPGAVHDYANRYTLHRLRINGTITLQDFVRTIKATQ